MTRTQGKTESLQQKKHNKNLDTSGAANYISPASRHAQNSICPRWILTWLGDADGFKWSKALFGNAGILTSHA